MGPLNPVTVLLARFEDLVARGLLVLLGEDPRLEVVAHDVPVERVAPTIAERAPAVALLNLGALSSPIAIHRLHAQHPGTRLIVLAYRLSPVECSQLLSFGATACLSKETQARDILSAIHLASRGLHVLPRSAEENGAAPGPVGPELLTRREADVLDLLRAGRSNAEIALSLHVGVETVRTHARNIYRKLGVRTRRELASPRGLPVSG